MPINEPGHPSQKVRGWLELDYADLEVLKERLDLLNIPYVNAPDASGALLIHDPNGNEIRAVAQARLSGTPAEEGGTWLGPREAIPPADSDGAALPGGTSKALGIRSVGFHIPPGSAAKVCLYYTEMFHAGAAAVHLEDTCVVRIGHHQSLVFKETAKPQEEYDGHHVAVYVNDFIPSWRRFHERDLVYHNVSKCTRGRATPAPFAAVPITHPSPMQHITTLQLPCPSLPCRLFGHASPGFLSFR